MRLTLRNRTLYGDYGKFYQNIYPAISTKASRAGHAGRVPQRQQAPEPVQPDRSHLERQARRHRPDVAGRASRSDARNPATSAKQVSSRRAHNRRRAGRSDGRRRLSPSPMPAATPTTAPGRPSRRPTSRTRSACRRCSKSSPGCASTASSSKSTTSMAPATEFSRKDELFSPRLGLIFKPMPNLSLYANYGRSYLPQSGDQFGGLTPTTEALKPERFDNYELGAKWEPIAGLLATAAIYRLDRTNTRATDPLNPAVTVLTGAQRSRGFELGLERSVSDRWQISAGYAWQKAKVTKATQPARPGIAKCRWCRATPSRCGIATTSRTARPWPWRHCPLQILHLDRQYGEAARLRPRRRRRLLQIGARRRGAGQCREYLRRRLFPDRQRRQQHLARARRARCGRRCVWGPRQHEDQPLQRPGASCA